VESEWTLGGGSIVVKWEIEGVGWHVGSAMPMLAEQARYILAPFWLETAVIFSKSLTGHEHCPSQAGILYATPAKEMACGRRRVSRVHHPSPDLPVAHQRPGSLTSNKHLTLAYHLSLMDHSGQKKTAIHAQAGQKNVTLAI